MLEKLEGIETWTVKDKNTQDFFIAYVKDQVEQGIVRVYTIQKADRTFRQNNALHLLFRRMAEGLNDAGFGIPHPMNSDMEMPYSEESIKTLLWTPIIQSLYSTTRSSHLDTEQLSHAAEVLIDAVNLSTGVYIPFPHPHHPLGASVWTHSERNGQTDTQSWVKTQRLS